MRQRRRMFASEIVIPVVVLAALGGVALAAQDKYTVKVPNGLAFSDFRGYEDWRTVAVSQAGDLIEVILGNPVMIDAYRAGIPGNGKHFPDGAKMAKIHWKAKKSAEAPDPTTVPDTLHDIDFMEKDSKKFRDSGGWGYAQFNYNTASGTFAPEGSGSNCGYSCHTIVAAKDYIFTAYGKR
jgi:Cytochrome P460